MRRMPFAISLCLTIIIIIVFAACAYDIESNNNVSKLSNDVFLTDTDVDVFFSENSEHEAIESLVSHPDNFNPVSKNIDHITDNLNQIMQCDIEDVIVTITFNKLITYEVLDEMISIHHIKPYKVYTRYVKAGERGGGVGKIDLNNGITLKSIHSNVMEDAIYASDCGYIALCGLVDSKQLDSLFKNGHIFTVDTSADGWFRGNTQKSGAERNRNDNSDSKIHFTHHTYVQYEMDTGIQYSGE